jgi:hypothetical protein
MGQVTSGAIQSGWQVAAQEHGEARMAAYPAHMEDLFDVPQAGELQGLQRVA